ncbi:MAG: CpcT/CpeT family chromophore lyase, partial [Pseudomonadota bacterium]
ALLTRWFEGHFDNDAQLWFQNKPEQRDLVIEPHAHNHVRHVLVDVPRLGTHVFYVEASRRQANADRDDPASEIWRRELVAWSAEGPEPRYRLRTYRLRPAPAGSERPSLDAANAASWSGALLEHDPACDVVFARVGDQFHGTVAGRLCLEPVNGEPGYRIDERVLSARKYWRRERVLAVADDRRLRGSANPRHLKMRKADFYRCQVNFPVQEYGVPDERDVQLDDLRVHDQGGRLQVTNPLNDKRYLVQLREKEYPYSAEDTDFLLFRLREVGQRRSALMLSLDPDAQRISANLGWMQVACRAEAQGDDHGTP